MNKTKHVNVVLTDLLCDNNNKCITMLRNTFDVNNVDIEWSLTILNRTKFTVDTIKALTNELPQLNNKNVYEMSYYNTDWTRNKSINEVFKILPTSVFCEDIVIIVDSVISEENSINASYRTIHNIYGLWDDPNTIPMFMKSLRYNMKEKCPDFRTLLHNRDDIKQFMNDDTWEFIHTNIKRKVVLADISRYYMMWRRGGLYLDMDVMVNDDLKQLIDHGVNEGNRLILFTEHDNCDPNAMGPLEDKRFTHRLYNCMFWSLPGESFWKNCIDLALERCKGLLKKKTDWTDVDILWASGPDIITTVFHTNFEDSNYIKVFSNAETRKLLVHMNGGTWRNNKDLK